jgi:ribonuclease HII
MIKPTTSKEKELIKSGITHIIGVDEVGVGCLAGPVVTAALRFEASFFDEIPEELELVRDSKTLSHLQRTKLDKRIRQYNDIKILLTKCTPATIDKYNIYRATRRASLKAAEKLCKDVPNPFVLFDGPKKLESETLPQEAITKGDQKVFVIAAASIIAKVHRDNLMIEYDKKYPNYGFARHKGYGTTQHMAQLVALGATPIHRKSFKPVTKVL